MKSYIKKIALFTALLSVLMVAGCMKEEIVAPSGSQSIDERTVISTTYYPKGTLYGLSANNEIIRFVAGPPVTELGIVPVQGLKTSEMITGIDIRPATRQLYAVTNQNNIYVVNPGTGVSTLVSRMPFSPAVTGTAVAFDFNPLTDRIRIVTNADQNLTINPNTGAVQSVDLNISPAGLGVNSIAYARKSVYASTLYDISVADGGVYIQLDAKGATSRIGDTGLLIRGEGGFDISADNTKSLAVLFAASKFGNGNTVVNPKVDNLAEEANRLYAIDLRTGLATSLGRTRPMIGIAIP